MPKVHVVESTSFQKDVDDRIANAVLISERIRPFRKYGDIVEDDDAISGELDLLSSDMLEALAKALKI
jgi:hypothetical protein